MALQGSSAAGGAGPGLRLAARRAVWESLGLAKMRRGFGEKSRWPRGPRGLLDWTQERGACDGIVDAAACGHEGWSAVVGSSLEERTDKACFFSFSCSCFPIVVLLPAIL